jgi:hypothetical protein
MAWYLRAIGAGTEAVSYETLDQALEHVKTLVAGETASGHKVVNAGGLLSFYDGSQLINTVWIEGEDGNPVAIPSQ